MAALCLLDPCILVLSGKVDFFWNKNHIFFKMFLKKRSYQDTEFLEHIAFRWSQKSVFQRRNLFPEKFFPRTKTPMASKKQDFFEIFFPRLPNFSSQEGNNQRFFFLLKRLWLVTEAWAHKTKLDLFFCCFLKKTTFLVFLEKIFLVNLAQCWDSNSWSIAKFFVERLFWDPFPHLFSDESGYSKRSSHNFINSHFPPCALPCVPSHPQGISQEIHRDLGFVYDLWICHGC